MNNLDNDLADIKSKIDTKYHIAIDQLAQLIDEYDTTVQRSVSRVMTSQGLLYEQQDIMKYAITCHNKHISLHLMPIYCYAELHNKFKKIIKSGKFQKGCINFVDYNNLPLAEIAQLISESAAMSYPTQYQLDRK